MEPKPRRTSSSYHISERLLKPSLKETFLFEGVWWMQFEVDQGIQFDLNALCHWKFVHKRKHNLGIFYNSYSELDGGIRSISLLVLICSSTWCVRNENVRWWMLMNEWKVLFGREYPFPLTVYSITCWKKVL
jgi:hypothetical protein